ncbi:MAG TPA: DivIVA domain-containing protein [Deltaproteobacteria bacterium]|nr:DivIVA domain-containing protein [Deltaproteobacteria bacterium]HPJ93721.1 DivIVA domain-containing protein [Deltaproteobacteria bacterium]HPR50675.1 DivIVA domain-containing protein [Deltaproteobacteria bacterium]
MQLTPEMIREQRFKVKLSGFDKDEVTNFLIDIAEDLEELLEENNLLKSELESMKDKQKDLEDIFLSAKQFSDEKIQKAQEQGNTILAEAQQQAASLEEQAQLKIGEAENKCREILEEAQQKAHEVLEEAQRSKAALEQELVDLKAKRTSLISEIKSVLSSYQNWIREIGDVD